MILVAVSAIPPVTMETYIVQSGGTTPTTKKTWAHRASGLYNPAETESNQIDQDKWEKVRQIQPLPRPMVPTTVYLYPLSGKDPETGNRYFKINTRLRYYAIENGVLCDINNVESERQAGLTTDLLTDLVSTGLTNNIVACWEVPDEYIAGGASMPGGLQYKATSETEYGGFNEVYSKLKASAITYTPYSSYAQGVINNKARYGQSVTVKVYNPASGASLTKHIYDALPETALPGTAQYTLPYRIASDVRPDGCPIFSFQYNDGGTDQLSHATEFIKGGAWRKVQLDVQGVNGSYWDKLALNNSREELNTRTALALLGSAATMAAGGGMVGAGLMLNGIGNGINDYFNQFHGNLPFEVQLASIQGAGRANNYLTTGNNLLNKGGLALSGGLIGAGATVASYMMGLQRLQTQENILNARSLTAVAPIQIGQAEFMKDVKMNRFYYVFTSYSGNDMWNFDAFLTRFGYNVGNMPFRNRHLYSRKRFVYIKAREIKMVANNHSYYQVSQAVLNRIENTLKQGYRIWRCKPDAHWTLPDGNNIIEEKAYV